jgi:hypothetical protein
MKQLTRETLLRHRTEITVRTKLASIAQRVQIQHLCEEFIWGAGCLNWARKGFFLLTFVVAASSQASEVTQQMSSPVVNTTVQSRLQLETLYVILFKYSDSSKFFLLTI